MSEQSFMVYGFDVKVKFIQFLRAIAPVLGVEELGLKDGKMIADRIEEGTPLRIFVGSTPGLKGMLEKYAISVGAQIQQPTYTDFHGEVIRLRDARAAAERIRSVRGIDPEADYWEDPKHPWNEAELVPVDEWDQPTNPWDEDDFTVIPSEDVWDFTDEPDDWQAEKVREDHAPREDSRDELPTQTPSDWDWDRDFDDCLIDGDDGAGQTLTPLADAYLRNHGGTI